MKTISLKLEQVKKSKNGNTLVSLKTKGAQFKDTEGAVKIALGFIEAIEQSLAIAQQMGAKAVKVGGVNFSLGGKFYLYVTIDGQDYSLDDVFSIFEGRDVTQMSFRNPKALFVAMYQIIRTAEGKSPLLTNEGLKVANGTANTKLLN